MPKLTLPEGTLSDHADYALQYVRNEQSIKDIRKACSLKYHPDKDRTNGNAAENFAALTSFFDALKEPQKAMIYMVQDSAIDHTYMASATSSDVTNTKKTTSSLNVPLPSVISQELKNAIQNIYGLSDDDIQTLDDDFKKKYNSFFALFFNFKKIERPNGMDICSLELLASDLNNLVGKKNEAICQNIQKLKDLRIRYTTFECDVELHSKEVANLCGNFINDNEFKKNVFLVYLKMAYALKKERYFLFEKKNYAYALALLFKATLYLLDFTWIFAVLMLMSLFVITPIFLISFFMDAFMTLASASLGCLIWGVSVMTLWYLEPDLDAVFNLVPEYLTMPLCRGVHHMLEKMFDTTLSSSHFSDIIFDIKRQQATVGEVEPYSCFSWFATPQSAESESESVSEECCVNAYG